MSENIIEIRGLSIEFPLRTGTIHAVNNVNFDIPKGKITALVGESGSGKSTMASAILSVVSSPGKITNGSVNYKGSNVLTFGKTELRDYKWKSVAMVFQAAQNALNPVMTIEEQMIETVQAHDDNMNVKYIISRASELLDYVRLEPNRVLKAYPHELSGGMKQRVMIAFSLLLNPELVILDEPTTALDVITQDYIFDILQRVHKDFNVTMLLLTHDIGVVAKAADRVAVMYAGEIVEAGDIYEIFSNPQHPYAKDLIGAAPSLVDDITLRSPKIGAPPNLINLPPVCQYKSRCKYVRDICEKTNPEVTLRDGDHLVKCHLQKHK
jgi:peptide/nickel transport system ATP-binding protein